MPLDHFMREYDEVERHEIVVPATPERAWDAVQRLDFAESPIVKALFTLRGMPAKSATLAGLEDFGFVRLAEDPGREVVLGLVGQFWRLTGSIERVTAEQFHTYAEPGRAKAVINFSVEPAGSGARIATETRVRCTDDSSRRSFRRYWRFIGPFSAWTRREALRLIRRSALSSPS